MNIRVTGQTQVAASIAQIRTRASTQARFQDQVSSGLKVKAASDNPLTYASLSQSRAAAQAFGTSLEVASDATTSLDASVAALLDGNQILTRAKQLAITGADAGTNREAFEGLAAEVDSLIDRFLQAANTEFDGDYLFGGDNTKTRPFRVSGTDEQGRPTAVTYDGSATPAQTNVGGNFIVETRTVGSEAFQTAGANVFQALIQLRDNFRDPSLSDTDRSVALNQRLADVDAARESIAGVLADKSSALSGLEAVQNRLLDLRLANNARTGELQATDFADAVLRLREEEAAYQATLNVAANLIPPSLFDFIQ